MEEKLDTGNDPAQNVDDQVVDQNLDDPDKDSRPFNEKEEQFIGSWVGRIVAKQFDEKVIPLLNERMAHQPSQTYTPPTDDVVSKFNEEISSELFTNPLGAFQKMMNVYQGTQKTLSQTQKTQADKALLSYSENPYYKEIFTDMQKVAHDAVGQGYPPEAAAEYAFQKSRADFLEKRISGDEGKLEMLGGGIPRKRTQKVTLPPQFKAAFERDKAKGLFKTEEEFISALSPQVRAQYGI